jgi:18S rRNA (guanine1575-N7)-methyltransferase
MTRNKKPIPVFPIDYIGKNALEYNSQKWMERNQKRSTLECLEYLFDEKLGDLDRDKSYLILDLGSGTGFSSEILFESGFRVIGLEILKDMIDLAIKKKKEYDNNNYELILADINHLPLKSNTIDHVLSISAYNFIIHGSENLRDKRKVVNNTAKYLNKILKEEGRIIIEFYPKDDEELEFFKNSFSSNKFDGYTLKKNPNQKSGQTFLILKKTK